MKINIGDILITIQQNTILVVDININGMLRGIYSGETEVRNVGNIKNICFAVENGNWKHYPVIE